MSATINDEVIRELIKRVEGESDAAYSAFCRYALMDEKDRPFEKSIPVLAETSTLSESTIKQYAVNFKWNERVGSIVSYLLMLNIKEQHELNRELNLTFIETNREVRIELMEAIKKTTTLLTKTLNWAMVANEEKVTEWIVDSHGNEVPVKTEVKMAFKPADIPALFTALKKGVELVNEIPTEIINNRPISNVNVSSIEDIAKLDELERQIAEEMAQLDSESNFSN